MSDRYLSLVNSPVGSAVASRVGLPKPAVLRRFESGAPLLPGPALVATSSGLPATEVTAILAGAGVEVRDASSDDDRWAALVLDARDVRTPADLSTFRTFFAGRLRQLSSSGRVIVLGRAADGADIAADATRQALDGIVRSMAKELKDGSTANLLLVEDSASLESALRFLLSGRSAYVDGQPIRLGAGTAPAPADWDRPLAGKTALVTGAARGIGAAIASDSPATVRSDAMTFAPSRASTLAKVANRIGGTTFHFDVAAGDAPDKLLAHLEAHTDGLDILVHNAGITKDRLLANMKPEQWDAVIAVNLQSQLSINAALLESKLLVDESRVVCLSSTTGLSGNRGQTNYGATKAGVIGLVRSSAAAFATHGNSTINAVAPGFIDTEMTAKMPFATREVARRLSSLQQAGLPVDVAEAVSWLVSPGAGGVNGQVLRVCGQNLVGA